MYSHPIVIVSSLVLLISNIVPIHSSATSPPSSISPNSADNNISIQTQANPIRHQLTQSAPYAIESDNVQATMKNIVLRLVNLNNHTNTTTATNGKRNVDDKDPWILVGDQNNGTLAAGTRLNINLKKLLETLNYNNFTSELKFYDNDTGLVNITISNWRELSQSDNPNSADRLLLEELIFDANNSKFGQSNSGTGGPNDSYSLITDNHRYETRYPIRSKPIGAETITSPPIRSSIEVVAENYTMRKIAEEANVFAIKLLHQLNIEKLGSRNLIQSPFAVYQGLALLLSGAMGETAKEMDKALLGSQSSYENTKLTHDQDRTRLLASLSDVIRQLQHSSSNHLRTIINNETTNVEPYENENLSTGGGGGGSSVPYLGGTARQHLIVANNLLFSPSAHEISNEFKNLLNSYYNNTVLTKIETGSTESIQVVNGWIRRATYGVIPSVIDKRNTFDEFNVMALLCTSWLAQEWRDTFYRVSSSIRSPIRLKGQGKAIGSFYGRDESLLEFVDDNKYSHFVEFIKSKPTKNIHHYHSVFNGLVVDVVSVPFHNSNHRLIALTPIAGSSSSNNATQQQLSENSNSVQMSGSSSLGGSSQIPQLIGGYGLMNESSSNNVTTDLPPDSSLLSKLIASIVGNPRKAMRSLWNTVAPDIITKQTLHNMQLASQKNNSTSTSEGSLPPLVQLSIPMIRTEADSSISAALNHIGIVNSFDPDQANFIGINGHPFNYFKLHLSNVLSKTTFNLNERGINYDKTIKTLESMRIVNPTRQQVQQQKQQEQQNYQTKDNMFESNEDSSSINKLGVVDEVKLNKPFMYLVCDTKTKLILYTGIVRNPSQEGP